MSEKPPADDLSLGVEDPRAALRRAAYTVMIAVAAGMMLGRVLAVHSVDTDALETYRLRQIDSRLEEKRARLQRQENPPPPDRIEEELARTRAALQREAMLSRPFLSANDRSRWCTLRALVEPEMRVPGEPYAIDKVIQQRGWDTIDMVKHGPKSGPDAAPKPAPGAEPAPPEPWVQKDGKHLYSSKPPLLPTILAGEYWLICQITGMTLGTHPYVVGRFVLITINVIPLLIALVLLAKLVERFGTTDFGRLFVMGTAAFGTYLTTFSVTLNNHLPAAVCATIAIFAAVRIRFDGGRAWWYFLLAGLFGTFAAANELPALSLLAVLAAVLVVKAPWRTLLFFVPPAALVTAAFFWTNWIAHEELLPAYMHRSAADAGAHADTDADANAGGSENATDENWYVYTYERNGRTYKSYWMDPVGVDKGEPSPDVYALHVLVGHHGVFSLTPVWILSAVGLFLWLFPADRRLLVLGLLLGAITLPVLGFNLTRLLQFQVPEGVACGLRWLFCVWVLSALVVCLWLFPAHDRRLRALALLIGAITVAVLGFYLTRPLHFRSYGGVACGLRWLFWLTPLWLLAILPAADATARHLWLRCLALAALVLSVLSVTYPTWNPWTHPWLMVWFHYMGWIQ